MGYMTGGLTFDALRAANMVRLSEFRNRRGERVHKEPDGSDWSPAQWLQAIVGELGEYANVRKKFERGDLTPEEFHAAAADELADVQCYLDILAWQLNIDLGHATMEKWNRVSERIGSDVRLGPDDWYLVTPDVKAPSTQNKPPQSHAQTAKLGAPEMPRLEGWPSPRCSRCSKQECTCMEADIESIIDDIIRREGSTYTEHPSDRGGATKYGITQRAWEDYWLRQWEDWLREHIEGDFELPGEVCDITEQHARAFYRHEHVIPFMWISHRGLLDLAIDSSVNHGQRRTIQWLQSAAGVTVDGIVGPITTQAVNARPNTCYKSLLVRRLVCYANLASSDEKQAVFLRGWINRVCEFVR